MLAPADVGMGHLARGDEVLVAEGDGAEAMPHTPRYEPSWFYQDIPREMIDQCVRPRSRGGIEQVAASWLHKQLVALGHAANARSCHFMAHSWFECAYNVKDNASELLSSINMRLRLGQVTLASKLYEHVLQQVRLTDAQREVATRKLGEAKAAVASRAAAPQQAMQDEMAQLLAGDGSSIDASEVGTDGRRSLSRP